MTFAQIYNLVWLIVWSLFIPAGIWGIIAGNPVHFVTAGAGCYFSYLLFTDKEDGESLKAYFTRVIKAHKG